MTPNNQRKPHLLHVAVEWFHRNFSDPQAIVLAILLLVGLGVILIFGEMLAPVLAAVVVAYLLEGLVRPLSRWGWPRRRSVFVVFTLFLTFLLMLVFGVTPLMWAQTAELAREVPAYFTLAQEALRHLPERYPFVSAAEVSQIMDVAHGELSAWGHRLVALSLAAIPGLITLLIYLVLVPLLVFFFLKDKEAILAWFHSYLPEERHLAREVWHEVDRQIGNYVRGKFLEIVIVGVVTTIAFVLMDLKYAVLLGFLVGLSVLVPYVGAAVVTVPVALVAYFQWGWSTQFGWLMGIYAVIQALDGNVLVPLLFSEVVNLHPIAIIVAVLVFGGIWGFWGVFFAIPLATLVNAILRAWPRQLAVSESA